MGKRTPITDDEILGRRTVQPRAIPHAYQIEQWEKHEDAFIRHKKDRPTLNHNSFLAGWNAAFNVIYGGSQ